MSDAPVLSLVPEAAVSLAATVAAKQAADAGVIGRIESALARIENGETPWQKRIEDLIRAQSDRQAEASREMRILTANVAARNHELKRMMQACPKMKDCEEE